MSSESEAKPRRKSKGLIIKLMLGLGLIAIGGGGVFAAYYAGLFGEGEGHKAERNIPRLIRKGEVDPYAPIPESGKGEAAPADSEGEGGSVYHTSYYSFSEDFTSNLKNSHGLVQISLAASTRRDGRILLWMKKHELAIRSSILTVLADTPEEEVFSIEGKQRLQKRLTDSINKVLTDREGFGGVDQVYFKSFLVQ